MRNYEIPNIWRDVKFYSQIAYGERLANLRKANFQSS